MAETQSQPPFRPLPQKPPKVHADKKPDGTIYLSQLHAPGERPRTIPHALDQRASEHPDRDWLMQRDPQSDEWTGITYGQGRDYTHALAQAFLDMGAGPDAPVMILSGNSIESALVMMAAMTIGAPAAPISVPYSLMSTDHAKLKHCFETVKPKVIFVQQLKPFEAALGALGDHGCTIVAVEGAGGDVAEYASLLKTAVTPAVTAAMDKLNDASIGKYLFTSGSTGLPKPVPQTQGMMCAMIAGQEGLRDDARDPDYDPDEIGQVLDWLPWNHISGSNVNFNGALWGGATFWIDGGKPTAALFAQTVRNIREVSPQVIGTAPIALAMLADEMEEDEDLLNAVFKRLKSIGYGGATLSDDLYDRLQALAIKATGKRVPIVTMYGATETQGITVVHWEAERVGLIGLPLPGMTLKLVPTSGKLEVRVKGPSVMDGYHNMPEKNAEVFDDEGFYCLGDAARMVDEDAPEKGIIFDGRVGEDFKLSSGTWVSVGTLRPDLVAACSPLVFDAVICGQDKNFASAMVWPAPAAFEAYAKKTGGDMAAALGAFQTDLAAKIAAFNAGEPGSSRRIKRFTVLTEPPSIDKGEITDKGYVNQCQTQDCRSDIVEKLYAPAPDASIVQL